MGIRTLFNRNQQTLASLQATDFYGAVHSASCALRHLQRTDLLVGGSFFNDGIFPSAAEITCDTSLDQCMCMDKVGCSINVDALSFTYDCGIVLPLTLSGSS